MAHCRGDILEPIGPLNTEPSFEAFRAEEVMYQAVALPVVYVADEVLVQRD